MKIEEDPEEWTGTGVFIWKVGEVRNLGSSDKENSCVAESSCLDNRTSVSHLG